MENPLCLEKRGGGRGGAGGGGKGCGRERETVRAGNETKNGKRRWSEFGVEGCE